MFRSIFVITLFIVGSAQMATGQGREVSFDEYMTQYTEALIRSRKDASRHTEKVSWFKLGRVTGARTSILETDSKGSLRLRKENRTGARVQRCESIEVDGISFSRTGNGRWVDGDCEGDGAMVNTLEGEMTATYSLEELPGGSRVFKALTTTIQTIAGGRRTGRIFFTENTVEINSEGYIVKREYISGVSPRIIDYTVSESYQYNIAIPEIKTPVK